MEVWIMPGSTITRYYRYPRRWLLFCYLLLLTSLPYPATGQPHAPLKVFVSIAPQAFFARAVGGAAIDVEILLPSGQSPATYEPTPQQMGRLAEADVYFSVGVPFEERLLEELGGSLEHLKVVSTIDGIALRPISGHRHGLGGDDHGGRPDPHTWLAPPLVKMQARNICNALCELDPVDSLLYEGNLSIPL
jgi:zinc transport system substrate-binding protein